MRIQSIDLNADGGIETLTVRINLRQANAIRALFGRLNWYAQQRLGLYEEDNMFDVLQEWLDEERLYFDVATINEPSS